MKARRAHPLCVLLFSTVVKLDGRAPTKYELKLNINDTFAVVKENLSEKCKLPVDSILLTEVMNCVIKVRG